MLKRDDSEVWRTIKVASIHQLEKQYATKQVEHNLHSELPKSYHLAVA